MADDQFGEVLAAVARDLLAEPDVQQTLQRAVELAARHLDGEVWASVSITHRRRDVDTPAASDERARRADQLQYELSEGPCLDAIAEHETFYIDDLESDRRYPQWSRRVASEVGARSILSFQLFTSVDTLGALNLYSPHVAAFDELDLEEGRVFAAQAAVALQSARTEEQLRLSMHTRTTIGQAQGILMERYAISAERAFEFLRRLSQNQNIKLITVADRIVATRETPRQGGHGQSRP